MKIVYIEKQLADHPRVERILQRLGKDARVIYCQHYGEVFNPKGQNFRLQKHNPALILAAKHNRLVLPTPEGFGIGGQRNFYFSHMLNCLYDCRYCFLQGMYPSAHHLLFINYEDFIEAITNTIQNETEHCYFFTGYDADSLAYEPVSHFCQEFLPFFKSQDNATFELRSKSSNVRCLLQSEAVKNCVVAFSFTPEIISQQVEHKVPSVAKRIAAASSLSQQQWPIGLRFDPLIDCRNFTEHYQRLIDAIFQAIDPQHIHSVSIGPLRFPNNMYKKLVKLYPHDKLLAQPLIKRQQHYSYQPTREADMTAIVRELLTPYLQHGTIFNCSAV